MMAARSRQIAGRAPTSLFKQTRGAIKLTPVMVEGLVEKFFKGRFDHAVDTPPFHRDMWEMCCSAEEYVACIAPRDHAKSTAGTHSYGLAELLFRHRDNCMIVSNTEDQAAIFLKEMKSECENNVDLVDTFKIVSFEKDNDTEWICVFDDGYKFRVTAYGSEQQVRGTKWEAKRPNLILLDDFENAEQMKEAERRKKIRTILLEDIIPAGSTDCLVRAFGTILHDDAMLARIASDPTWYCKVWRAHTGYNDFSNLLWPEKWPEAKLRKRRQMYEKQGNGAGYSKEYLNDPAPPEISFFKEEYFQPFREGMFEAHQKGLLNYYSCGDIATGEETSDYGCIVTVGIDPEGYMYVVDVRRERWDTKEFVDQIFEVHALYRPQLFGIEKGGLEKSIKPWLNDQMLRRASYPNIIAMTPGKSKEWRAGTIQAKMKARHVFFDTLSPWFETFKDELTRFPNGANDDQVDAFAYIGLMLDKSSDAPSDEEREDELYEEVFGSDITDMGKNVVTGY